MFQKGISFPFRILRGRIATSVADYNENTKVKESVYQIITITLGEWANEPQIGSRGTNLVFANGSNIDDIILQIIAKIEELDTRISKVTIDKIEDDSGILTLNVSYEYLGQMINQYFKFMK